MIRIVLLLVFLFISFSVTLAESHLLSTKLAKPIVIPFFMKGDLMIVELKLEGFIPLNLIFDTGAEFSLLFKKPVIDLLNIKYDREVKVIGADRSQILSAYPIKDINFKLGQTEMAMDFLLLKEDYFDVESYVGFKVDGILGSNFFKNFLVEIDNRRRFIKLHPKESAVRAIPKDFSALDVIFYKDRLFIPCRIEMTNSKTSEIYLLMDSGAATSALFFLNSDSSLMNISERIIPTKIGMGLGGYLNGYSAKIKYLEISEFSFHDLIIHYQKSDSLYMQSNFSRKNGMIGNQILKRFDYYLDYENERIYLKANKKFAQKLRTDKSGIILLASGPYLSQFYIAYIQENSTGAASGLKVGDEIISINRRPKFTLSLDKIYKLFSAKEGKEYTIVVKREGKKMRHNIVLKSIF